MTEATELQHVLAGDTLRYAGADVPSGLYKIRIPAGAVAWRVGVQTYRVDEPARALLAMDAPPDAARAEPVGTDTRQTLQRLWAGATILCESPGNSGTLSISQPEMGGAWRADRERWLYLQLDFPGGRTLGWQSQVVLDAAFAQPPAAPGLPEPDLALRQRTLGYAHQAGLVAALMKTSGARDDEQLIDWMTRQGDLWFAICRLAGAAEGAHD